MRTNATTDRPAWGIYLLEILSNAVLVLLFGYFAYWHGANFIEHQRIGSLLLLLIVSLTVLFVLIRELPTVISFSPLCWFLAIGGTISSLLFRPADHSNEFIVGHAVQCLGIVLALWAISSLNKSFGIVPSNRGIKRDGMYRFVRHPLYFSYIVAYLGYIANNLTLYNGAVLLAVLVFQISRIFREERLLMRDEQYRAYAAETRWRLVPWVF